MHDDFKRPLPSDLRKEFIDTTLNEQALRKSCAALKNIMMVGGTNTVSDYFYLETALLLLTKSEIPIDSNPIINDVSLSNGHDFLTTKEHADVIITCFIDNQTTSGYKREKSPLHFNKKAWYESAQRVDAKIIFTNCLDKTEICGEHFEGSAFVRLPDFSAFKGNILVSETYIDHLNDNGIININSELGKHIYSSRKKSKSNISHNID